MKTCKKCGQEKPLNFFYKHKAMLDGYLNICIECVKERVRRHRAENIERFRDYDKQRAMLPHRVESRKLYLQTENGKQAKKKASENYKQKHPMKYAAHIVFRNAVRDKKIKTKNTCEVCGSNNLIEGHHDDYTKPLDVRWLCVKCHKEWHKHNEPVYF